MAELNPAGGCWHVSSCLIRGVFLLQGQTEVTFAIHFHLIFWSRSPCGLVRFLRASMRFLSGTKHLNQKRKVYPCLKVNKSEVQQRKHAQSVGQESCACQRSVALGLEDALMDKREPYLGRFR